MAVTTQEVWEEFNGALRGFIVKRVRDDDAADDILQEAFIKIHRNIGTLKDENRLQAWLYQITRNAIVDYYRKHKPTVELPEEIADEPANDPSVYEELAPCVGALVQRLPEKYREPLVMSEIEGRTQKDVGEALGLSLSGAKSRVQRGRRKLKESLEECCRFEFDRLGNVVEYEPKDENAPECCDASCDAE